jgi:flavin-dependent dehydrogenase
MVNDVAIVGGGPAGSALAIELGRRGVRVALYERARFPRLKACGEGLLPHGVAALRGLGGLPEAPRVSGLRFAVGGESVDAPFPNEPGLVVRRDRFDRWLLERAAATPNVDARLGACYRPDGEHTVVGADGRRSMFHRRLSAHAPMPRRVGLSAHASGIADVRDRVEVFFHEEGELYLAPSGGDEALVAGLFWQSRFRRDGLARLIRSIPEVAARCDRLVWTTPILASAPLGLRVPKIVGERLLLIGDAAGAPDPITGDGIALAITSARPAADAIVSGDFRSYEDVRLAMGRTADRLGRLLLRISRVRGAAARALLSRPSLVPTLLDVALGKRPMTVATAIRSAL